MNTTTKETRFQTICPLGYVVATYYKREHAEQWLARYRAEQADRGIRLGEIDYSTLTVRAKLSR